jgi:hypothetical protein
MPIHRGKFVVADIDRLLLIESALDSKSMPHPPDWTPEHRSD